MSYRNVLVVVCIFSGWVEAFPYWDSLTVDKDTVRKCVSHLGVTFQLLPQGYSYSPTICHGMVARDLSLFSFLTSVKRAHYIDDIMLTCEDLPLLQKSLQALLKHLRQRGRAVNLRKIQAPGTAIMFCGGIWSGKSCVVPNSVIDKVQAYPIQKHVKEVQALTAIMEYWQTFIPDLGQRLCPLRGLAFKIVNLPPYAYIGITLPITQ